METLSILVNAILLVGLGLVLTYLGRDRFDKLERDTQRQFAGLQADMHQRFADVHQRFADVREDISEVRSEVSVLRSDVTHIALAVGARHRPNTG